MIQVSMTLTIGFGQSHRSRSNFQKKKKKKKGIKTKHLAISWMLFQPQTSSHLLSQLFVTHFGVAFSLIMSCNTIISIFLICTCISDYLIFLSSLSKYMLLFVDRFHILERMTIPYISQQSLKTMLEPI